MIAKFVIAALASSTLTFSASAQIPTTGSLAGVTIISPGSSIKPQDLMPAEPFRPGPPSPVKRRSTNPATAPVGR